MGSDLQQPGESIAGTIELSAAPERGGIGHEVLHTVVLVAVVAGIVILRLYDKADVEIVLALLAAGGVAVAPAVARAERQPKPKPAHGQIGGAF